MSDSTPIPVFLLKSPSPTAPTDAYATHLTAPSTSPKTYSPHFIPVLTHTLLPDPLINLLLAHFSTPLSPPFPYSALIFTSQRAVAALGAALTAPPIIKIRENLKERLRVRLYAVGPATAQALRDVSGRVMPSCEVYGGEEAGSGEVLARLILRDRGEGSGGDAEGRKEAVLFLAGEKRRDVIPRMLMDPGLGDGRIRVDEMVVYQTGELEEFEFHFSRMLGQTEAKCGEGVRWVVVFSPTAGKGMLKGLGWLDEGGCKVRKGLGDRRTFVACIGPTTRVYMEKEFGFKADVVAQKPSPQEVRSGIERFMEERGL